MTVTVCVVAPACVTFGDVPAAAGGVSTTCGPPVRFPVEVLNPASPEYTAVIVRLPPERADVVQVATAAAYRANGMALGSAVAVLHALIYIARRPAKLIQVR